MKRAAVESALSRFFASLVSAFVPVLQDLFDRTTIHVRQILPPKCPQHENEYKCTHRSNVSCSTAQHAWVGDPRRSSAKECPDNTPDYNFFCHSVNSSIGGQPGVYTRIRKLSIPQNWGYSTVHSRESQPVIINDNELTMVRYIEPKVSELTIPIDWNSWWKG